MTVNLIAGGSGDAMRVPQFNGCFNSATMCPQNPYDNVKSSVGVGLGGGSQLW